jgi:radical SAM superfamily enzyme YgiQ (UPF0313 family)
MDILLINPPYTALKGLASEHGYSINLVALATYLVSEGIDAKVLDANLLIDLPPTEDWAFDVSEYARGQENYKKALENDSHSIWMALKNRIRQYHPKVIGITCLTPFKDLADKITHVTKEVDNDIKVVVGGHHPTFCPDEMIENHDIDFVVMGEGELSLLQIVKQLLSGEENFDSVPGIMYRETNTIKKTPAADLIADLDTLPVPDRGLVIECDYERYKNHYISTARGCPYTCSFCSDRTMWQKKVRRRSVKNVIEELTNLKDNYNVQYIDFTDGTFTYNTIYLKEFCETLINENINVNWRCTARYNNINQEILPLLKEANCAGLYFGLESGSRRILEAIDKGTTVDQIIKVSQMVSDSGLNSITAVMIGLPGETREDIESTLKLMREIKTDIFDVNCYVPLPGTELYNKLSKEKRDGLDWKKIGYKSFNNHFTNTMSRDDLTSYLKQAYQIASETLSNFRQKVACTTIDRD